MLSIKLKHPMMQMCLQDCEAGDHAVPEHSNQHNSLLRLVPSWLGNLMPASSEHGQRHHSASVGPNTRQSGNIVEITDGASEDALLGLKAKRIAQDQHTRIGQSEAGAQDIFGLFSDPQSSSAHNGRQGTVSDQQQQQQGQQTDQSAAARQGTGSDQQQQQEQQTDVSAADRQE